MSRQTRWTVSEAHGHGVHSSQDELAFVESHILRVLHEKDFFACLPPAVQVIAEFALGADGWDWA